MENQVLNSQVGYKIIDEKDGILVIQCTYLRTVFKHRLSELIDRAEIIFGLSAEQACYVGIKIAQFLDKGQIDSINFKRNICLDNPNWKYTIRYETREKCICFFDKFTQQSYVLDPRNIALNQELINEFSSPQGFYIGFLSGLLSNKRVPRIDNTPVKSHLHLVK